MPGLPVLFLSEAELAFSTVKIWRKGTAWCLLKFFEFAQCFFVAFVEFPVSSAGARKASQVLALF
jgi:hypothetical protein